jgi:hypothetical protein
MSLGVLWFYCFPANRKNRGSGDYSGREPEERADEEREGEKWV